MNRVERFIDRSQRQRLQLYGRISNGVGVGVGDRNDNAGGDSAGDAVGETVGDSAGLGVSTAPSGGVGVGDTLGVGDWIGSGAGGATSESDSRVGINKLICAVAGVAAVGGFSPRR